MNTFILWLLIGFGLGIIVCPIALWIYSLLKDAVERRAVKRMIKRGEFLTPIDAKDYDVKAWENQITPNPEEVKELNDKIFNKREEVA